MAQRLQQTPSTSFTTLDYSLFTILSTIALIDLSLTYHALFTLPSRFYEQNPLVAPLLEQLGALALLIPYPFGLLVCTTLALIHPWKHTAFRYLLSIYIMFALFTVAHNTQLILEYYTPV